MNGTVQDFTVEDLITMAGGDENAGTVSQRTAVIAARAQLAGKGIPTPRDLRSMTTRERVAVTLEHIDPIGAIIMRCDEAGLRRDDKDEDDLPVLTPPPPPGKP